MVKWQRVPFSRDDDYDGGDSFCSRLFLELYLVCEKGRFFVDEKNDSKTQSVYYALLNKNIQKLKLEEEIKTLAIFFTNIPNPQP